MEAMRVIATLHLEAFLVACVIVVQACRSESLVDDVCSRRKRINDLAHLQKCQGNYMLSRGGKENRSSFCMTQFGNSNTLVSLIIHLM